jgi:hypothetical protein
MKLDVANLPKLHWVYSTLFEHIARHRPEMQREAEYLAHLVDELDYDAFDRVVQQSVMEIRGAFAFARILMKEAESADPKVTAMKLCHAYRMTQLQANYRHVLVDGVIMEGVFEDWSERRLQQIAETGAVDILDLLQKIVEPLTDYHYVSITGERIHEARQGKAELQQRLRAAGRDDLADYLERFIPFYSGIKRWQVEFKEAHRDEFMTVIDPLCETLVRTVRGLGLALTDEEVESNWALIAVVEAKILPFLCLLQAGGKPDSGSS